MIVSVTVRSSSLGVGDDAVRRRKLRQAGGAADLMPRGVVSEAVQEIQGALSSSIDSGSLSELLQDSGVSEMSRLSVKASGSAVASELLTPPVDKVAGEVLSVFTAIQDAQDHLDAILSSLGSSLLGHLTDGEVYSLENIAALTELAGKMQEEANALYALPVPILTAMGPEAAALARKVSETTAGAAADLQKQSEESLAALQRQVLQIASSQEFLGFELFEAEEGGVEGCLAHSASLHGSYNVTIDLSTQQQPSTSQSSGERRALLAKGGSSGSGSAAAGRKAFTWSGYSLYSASGGLSVQEITRTGNITLPRYIGVEGRNLLLGGLHVHQRRSGLTSDMDECSSRHTHLSARCLRVRYLEGAAAAAAASAAEGDRRTLERFLAELADPMHPFGSDPAFMVDKALSNPWLTGREGEFYNVSAGSPEINFRSFPYMWFPRGGNYSDSDGFPVVIDTAVGAARANNLWLSVEEGAYLDMQTESLEAQVVVLNSELDLFGTAELKFSWTKPGGLKVVATMPSALPSSPRLDFRLFLMVVLAAAAAAVAAVKHGPVWVAVGVEAFLQAREAVLSTTESSTLVQPISGLKEVKDSEGPDFGAPRSPSLRRPASKRSASQSSMASSGRSNFYAFMETKGFSMRRSQKRRLASFFGSSTVLDTLLAFAMVTAVALHIVALVSVWATEPKANYRIYESPQLSPAR